MSMRLGTIDVTEIVRRVMNAVVENNPDYAHVYFYDNNGREVLGFQGVLDESMPENFAPDCVFTIGGGKVSREQLDAFIENNYNLEVVEVSEFEADRHADELGYEAPAFEGQESGPFEPFYDVEPDEPIDELTPAVEVAQEDKQVAEASETPVAVAEQESRSEEPQETDAPADHAPVEPEKEDAQPELDAAELENGNGNDGNATEPAMIATADEEKPKAAKKIILSGGTVEDYASLIGSLKEAGLFDEASGLETLHITIENIAADAIAEKKAATAVLKDLTKEVIEKADGKLDAASHVLVDAAEHTIDAVAKNTNELVNKAGSIKQNFYDACKSGTAHVKQFGCKALGSILRFANVRSDIEFVQQNWADSRTEYLKTITACQEFAERKNEAKGLFKNAFRVAMGRNAEDVDKGKPGFFVQKYIDHLQRRVEKCEEKIDKCQGHIDHIDRFFVDTRSRDLVLAYGITTSVEKVGNENMVVFHASDVQSVFNAIESDPKAIYDANKQVIDPDGSQLNHYMSELKSGEFGEHSAYSMVVYNNSCWVNPETGNVEGIPQITDEQVRVAVRAAQNFGADTLIAEQDARNEKLWNQYQERLANEKDALDVATDTSRDVNSNAQPSQQEIKRNDPNLG